MYICARTRTRTYVHTRSRGAWLAPRAWPMAWRLAETPAHNSHVRLHRTAGATLTVRNSTTQFIAMADRGEFDVLIRLTSWDGDHLQGSWTVLPHGASSQDHCDYLSLQRSLGLKDDDTPGTMPAYEFFSRFLAWMYLGRLAEVAGRQGNRILTGPRKILTNLLDFWNRSKKDWWSEEKRFFESCWCWCIPTDTGTKIQFMKLADDKGGN